MGTVGHIFWVDNNNPVEKKDITGTAQRENIGKTTDNGMQMMSVVTLLWEDEEFCMPHSIVPEKNMANGDIADTCRFHEAVVWVVPLQSIEKSSLMIILWIFVLKTVNRFSLSYQHPWFLPSVGMWLHRFLNIHIREGNLFYDESRMAKTLMRRHY